MTNEDAIYILLKSNEHHHAMGDFPHSAKSIEAFNKAIAALKAERPQGEWINHRNDYGHNIADCSLCGKTMQWHDEDGDGVPRYCWYCGAPMKGVKND